MDKLTTEEIIKIIWGDLDRKLFGNLFYRINKRIKDNFTPVYYGNIKYNKKTIIKELRSCNFTCSDIQCCIIFLLVILYTQIQIL